jgi:hypothetical protein
VLLHRAARIIENCALASRNRRKCRRRGVHTLDYASDILREKLLGQGLARLPPGHPAAKICRNGAMTGIAKAIAIILMFSLHHE